MLRDLQKQGDTNRILGGDLLCYIGNHKLKTGGTAPENVYYVQNVTTPKALVIGYAQGAKSQLFVRLDF